MDKVESRHLYVGGMHRSVTKQHLLDHFGRYGQVENVKLLSRKTHQQDQNAFVDFAEIEAAVQAHRERLPVDGSPVRIDFNHTAPRKAHRVPGGLGGAKRPGPRDDGRGRAHLRDGPPLRRGDRPHYNDVREDTRPPPPRHLLLSQDKETREPRYTASERATLLFLRPCTESACSRLYASSRRLTIAATRPGLPLCDLQPESRNHADWDQVGVHERHVALPFDDPSPAREERRPRELLHGDDGP